MSTDIFELHIQQSLAKLENLWQRSYSIPHPENELWRQTTEFPQQQQQLLQESLEELAASIEELQLASETLRQQNDELIASRQQIEAQRQYYQELFDLAPDCYFITSKEGTIKEANQKTAELLQVSPQYLSRKSLAVFIALDDRQQYYQILNQLKQGEISDATWQLEIVNRQQQVITAKCLVMAKRDRAGEIVNLHWRISSFYCDSHNQNTTNLMPILVNSLRYPLYNLATQVKETISSNQSQKTINCGSLENISHDILNLKQIVNNAYVIECLTNKNDLHPALIDYSSFIDSLIKRTRKSTNFPSEILLTASESCVGISDVLCLEQIIVNLLQLSSQQAAINPIQIEVSKSSGEHLEAKIEFTTNPTPVEQVLNILEPLVGKESFFSINKMYRNITDYDSPSQPRQGKPLSSLDDLSLAVVYKCVHLLKGSVELAAVEDKITLKVTLPLVLVTDVTH